MWYFRKFIHVPVGGTRSTRVFGKNYLKVSGKFLFIDHGKAAVKVRVHRTVRGAVQVGRVELEGSSPNRYAGSWRLYPSKTRYLFPIYKKNFS